MPPTFPTRQDIPLFRLESDTYYSRDSLGTDSLSLNCYILPLYTFLLAYELICSHHSLYIIYESIRTGFWRRPVPEGLDVLVHIYSTTAYILLLSQPKLDKRVLILFLASTTHAVMSILIWTIIYEFPFPSLILDVIIPVFICCLLSISTRTQRLVSPYKKSAAASSIIPNALGCCLFLLYSLTTITIAVFAAIMIFQASSFFVDYLSYISCFIFNMTFSLTALIAAFHPIDRMSWLGPVLLGMSLSYILTLTQWLRRDFYMPDVWLATPIVIALFRPQSFLATILLPHRRLRHEDTNVAHK